MNPRQSTYVSEGAMQIYHMLVVYVELVGNEVRIMLEIF